MNLEQKLEAILFYKNEPQSLNWLSKTLAANLNEVRTALQSLQNNLSGRGVSLILTEQEAALVTTKEAETLIAEIAKDEMSSDMGKAGLETLAIILYNGTVSRREIDYVRGVNSTFILRNLCMRGLIEKETDPKDQRTFRYKPSVAIFAHLGIRGPQELPGFNEFQEQLAKALTKQHEQA